MNKKEISLLDLMLEVLFHWRKIIVLALVGGFLFGGVGYIRAYQNVQAQRAQLAAQAADDKGSIYAVNKEQLEKQLTKVQNYNVNTAIIYEQLYRDRVDYQEHSVLMNIDANNIPRSQLIFWIKSEDENKAYDIERIYENLVCSGELSTFLAAECEMEESVVSEIITVMPDARENRNTFCLSIIHYDEAQCNTLASAAVDYINERQKDLQQILGTHEVILVSQSIAMVKDMEIMNYQLTCHNNMTSAQVTAARLIDAFSAGEWQYYNFMTGNKLSDTTGTEEKAENATVESTEANSVPLPRPSVKYIMTGMILAVFAYVFIIVLFYVFSNRLKAVDDFHELYGIPQLGQVLKQREGRFLGFIDRWLISLRSKNRRMVTVEEAVGLSAAAVKIAAKNNALDTICMVGCNMKKGSLPICEQIQTILDKDVSVKILDNVLYDAEAMEALGNSQGVVLVERAGSTLYAEIINEIELLQRQNIKILGGIVVE